MLDSAGTSTKITKITLRMLLSEIKFRETLSYFATCLTMRKGQC